MKSTEFDKKFDDGEEDVLDSFDLNTAKRVNHGKKQVNVDFPAWMVQSLDQEAQRIGITRQALIKLWLSERLDNKHP